MGAILWCGVPLDSSCATGSYAKRGRTGPLPPFIFAWGEKRLCRPSAVSSVYDVKISSAPPLLAPPGFREAIQMCVKARIDSAVLAVVKFAASVLEDHDL